MHKTLAKRCFSGQSIKSVNILQISYTKLTDHSSDAALEVIDKAYSENGLGTLAISGVPGFAQKRKTTLLQAWRLANLPREAREKLERPEHFYQVGWEHGEYGFLDGRDSYMGSFFSNPIKDKFIGEDGKEWANAWPEDDLPTLRPAVQDLSQTMQGAALHLAKHLDKYVRMHLPSFEKDFFSRTVATTPKVNSRLIHYFPCKQDFTGQWTGWHKDLGMLTCLTPALYTDSKGNEINWSDPSVGLHGQSRTGEVMKVNVPKDCMIVQIGEALEVKTGGFIKALPHAVLPNK